MLRGIHSVHFLHAEHAAAREVAREFLRLAEAQAGPTPRSFARVYMGASAWACGELAAARRHLETALDLYDPERDKDAVLVYGHDARAAALQHLSPVLCVLGCPDTALARAEEGMRHGEQLPSAFAFAWTLSFATRTLALRRDYRAMLPIAERLARLGAERDLPLARNFAAMHLGRAQAGLGQLDEGMDRIRGGLAANRTIRTELLRGEHLAELAEALLGAERIEEAEAVVHDALHCIERTGERFAEAELRRLEGEVRRRGKSSRSAAEAQACFVKSLQLARRQGARLWELRSATSLARLRREQGKPGEARRLLRSACDRLTEGLDLVDLSAARALLTELS